MKRKKVLGLNCVIFFIILSSMLLLSLSYCYGMKKNVPDIVEYRRINNEGIDFKTFDKIKNQETQHLECTAYSEAKCSVKNAYGVTNDSDAKTKLVLADENYFSLYNHNFIKGRKPDSGLMKSDVNVAVISEKLAVDMYKTVHVIGNKIDINGQAYTIMSVYKNDDSYIYKSSEDGYERIIIPYDSYKNKDLPVLDVLSVKHDSSKNTDSVYSFEKSLSSNIDMYTKTDLSLSKNINFQYLRILLFVVGCLIIVLLCRLIIKVCKNLKSFIKGKLKDYYFMQLLCKEKRQLIMFLLKTGLIIALIIIIFSLAKFNIVVNDKYLPNDNIFDISFYKKAIINNSQIINAGEGGFSTFSSRYTANIGTRMGLNLLAQIVCLVLFMVNLKALIAEKKYDK